VDNSFIYQVTGGAKGLSNNDIIVSLDIGTSKVRAIIGEVVNGRCYS
jgi:hypothetical protein